LDVRRAAGVGWVLFGANELALTLAGLLRDSGEEVVCIDNNSHACGRAEALGLRVFCANALEERTLLRAEIDVRAGAVGVTPNEEANLLFVQKARQLGPPDMALAAVEPAEIRTAWRMVHDVGGGVLFGGARDVGLWSRRLRQDAARVTWWRLDQPAEPPADTAPPEPDGKVAEPAEITVLTEGEAPWLPLISRRGDSVRVVGEGAAFRIGDEVAFLLDDARADEARETLQRAGWRAL